MQTSRTHADPPCQGAASCCVGGPLHTPHFHPAAKTSGRTLSSPTNRRPDPENQQRTLRTETSRAASAFWAASPKRNAALHHAFGPSASRAASSMSTRRLRERPSPKARTARSYTRLLSLRMSERYSRTYHSSPRPDSLRSISPSTILQTYLSISASY